MSGRVVLNQDCDTFFCGPKHSILVSPVCLPEVTSVLKGVGEQCLLQRPGLNAVSFVSPFLLWFLYV